MNTNDCLKESARLAYNVLQLGAVCVGLWVGNCAKVLLGISIFKQKGRQMKYKLQIEKLKT